MRPSRCWRSDGLHGQSRSWRATSLVCTLVPAPIFAVEPTSTRTRPSRTAENSAAFLASVAKSCMKATSSSGTPFSTSSRFSSAYTLNPSPFGVERSQKTSCDDLSGAVSSHIPNTLSAQARTLPWGWSGSCGSNSRWSRATLRPSFVILSMLSASGATLPLRTSSARFPRPSTMARWCSDGSKATFRKSTSGTGSFSMSAVCTSATILNRLMSSGRL